MKDFLLSWKFVKKKKKKRIVVKNELVNTPVFYFIVSNTHYLGNFF